MPSMKEEMLKHSANPLALLSSRTGVVTFAGDGLQIRMFGRGAHGSMPKASIDPVLMAAATVLRLQTIVSREIATTEAAVTVGALQAGTKKNVIPEEAGVEALVVAALAWLSV
jgi:metal-dependent amidase/aminoacylase/carboxypeptidase family protein